MKNIEYDSSMPLKRLEKGDKAIISVRHFDQIIVNDKDRIRYKDIPNGKYKAVCIDEYKLECKEYPALSGRYCFHGGNKWGCSEGIFANEMR